MDTDLRSVRNMLANMQSPETSARRACRDSEKQSASQFGTTARLYSEAATYFSIAAVNMSSDEYEALWKTTEEARRAEAAGIARKEHYDWHRCQAKCACA